MNDIIKPGSVVISIAGYDKDEIYVVKELEDNYALLINGKNRPFSKPKRKNLKHIKAFSLICELDFNNERKTNQNVNTLIVLFKKALKNL